MFYSASTGGFYDPEIHGGSIPADAVEITADDHATLMEGQSSGLCIMPNSDGFPELADRPPLTGEELKADFVAKIQARLDGFARTRGYDSILSACTYATSSVPKFQVEGQYCVEARDATWTAAYQLLDEVQSGERPMPSGIVDIEGDLPVLAWPQ